MKRANPAMQPRATGTATGTPTGFTLVELMIAVAILGILASIAYPNYAEYVARGRRADGKAALLTAMQALERRYAQASSYVDPADNTRAWRGFPQVSDGGNYDIAAGACGALALNECVQVSAVPAIADSRCGTLLLRSTGERGVLLNNVASFANLPQGCW